MIEESSRKSSDLSYIRNVLCGETELRPVNVKKFTGGIEKGDCQKGFDSLVCFSRKDNDPSFYLLLTCPNEGDRFILCRDIEHAEILRPKSLKVKSRVYSLNLEFMHPRDCVFVFNFMKSLFRAQQPFKVNHDRVLPELNIPPEMVNYITRTMTQKKVGFCRKVSPVSSSIVVSLNVPDSDWDSKNIGIWLQNVFYQDEIVENQPYPPIITLREKLEEIKVLFILEEYLSYRTLSNLYREICQYEKKGTCDTNTLLTCFQHDRVRIKMKESVNFIHEYGNGFFHMEYFLVLQKWIQYLRDRKNQRNINLKELEDRLLHGEERRLWDVHECRDYILFLIAFRVDPNSYIQKKEEEFLSKEKEIWEVIKQKKRGFEEEDDDDGEELDEEDELIGSFGAEEMEYTNRFEKLLMDYNQENGFIIESLSFEVCLLVEKNKLIKEKARILTQVQKEVQKLKELKVQLRNVRANLSEVQHKIAKISEKMKKVAQGPLSNLYQRQIQVLEDRAHHFEELENNVLTQIEKRNVRKVKEQVSQQVLEKEREIRACQSSLRKEEMRSFNSSKSRKNQILQMSQKRVNEIYRSGDYYMRTRQISQVMCRMKRTMIRPDSEEFLKEHLGVDILDREFVNFGAIKESVYIGKIGLHWGDNAMVWIDQNSYEDDYETIFCADDLAPVVMNFNNVFHLISDLSNQIVVWNAYVPFGKYTTTSSQEKNCTAFCEAMLSQLKAVPHFPNITDYLNKTLREYVIDGLVIQRNFGLKDFRRIKVPKSFEREYSEVWNEGGLSWLKPKNGVLVFRNLNEVQTFSRECMGVNRDGMVRKYPGVFHLLSYFEKSFDFK